MKRDVVFLAFALVAFVAIVIAGILRAVQIGQPEIAAVGCAIGLLVAAACVGLVLVLARNR